MEMYWSDTQYGTPSASGAAWSVGTLATSTRVEAFAGKSQRGT